MNANSMTTPITNMAGTVISNPRNRSRFSLAAVLPLGDERRGRAVLAQRVELHRTLHAGKRDAAVQVGDDLGVVGAAGRGDRLVHDLAHGVGLGDVGADARRVAAVL